MVTSLRTGPSRPLHGGGEKSIHPAIKYDYKRKTTSSRHQQKNTNLHQNKPQLNQQEESPTSPCDRPASSPNLKPFLALAPGISRRILTTNRSSSRFLTTAAMASITRQTYTPTEETEIQQWLTTSERLRAPSDERSAILDTLSTAIAAAINTPDLKAQLNSYGYETVGSTPAAFADHINKELDTWKQAVEVSGAKLN